VNNVVESARKRLFDIEEEAEKLRLFLAAWEGVADLLTPSTEATSTDIKAVDKSPIEAPTGALPRTRAVNPPTDQVVEAAIHLLRVRGHPMSRSALHSALWERGVKVRGTDPVKTLGTILWRAKDRIIQLEGYGYWPKNVSYARANYFQPQEPKITLQAGDIFGFDK
jgi:hypothetical protein